MAQLLSTFCLVFHSQAAIPLASCRGSFRTTFLDSSKVARARYTITSPEGRRQSVLCATRLLSSCFSPACGNSRLISDAVSHPEDGGIETLDHVLATEKAG